MARVSQAAHHCEQTEIDAPMSPRDDFSEPVKRALAARVGNLCSNPDCRALTSGPHEDTAKSVNLGVAAHITAAAPGGPRYDATLTQEQRSSAENCIWLCQTCAKLIDSDSRRFPVSLLQGWKAKAEEDARSRIGKTGAQAPTGGSTYHISIQNSTLGSASFGDGAKSDGRVDLRHALEHTPTLMAASSSSPGRVAPQLRLALGDVLSDRLVMRLQPPALADESFVAAEMERIREENPRLGHSCGYFILDDGTRTDPVEFDHDAYLDKFLAKSEGYLRKLVEFRVCEARTVCLPLAVINDGRAPAEEVSIAVEFPAHVEVWDRADESRHPKPPEQPLREKFARLMREQEREAHKRWTNALRRHDRPNVLGVSVQQNERGALAEIEVHRIKHDRKPVKLADLCVMFPSFETAQSFSLDYRIFTTSLPDVIEGQLAVVIEKHGGGAASIA